MGFWVKVALRTRSWLAFTASMLTNVKIGDGDVNYHSIYVQNATQ